MARALVILTGFLTAAAPAAAVPDGAWSGTWRSSAEPDPFTITGSGTSLSSTTPCPGASGAGVRSTGQVTSEDGTVSRWEYTGEPECPGVGGTFTATMSADCLTVTTDGVTQYGTPFETRWTRQSAGPAGCGEPPETIELAPGTRWGGAACGASATISQSCKPVILMPGQGATASSPPLGPSQTEAVVHVSGDAGTATVLETIRKRRNQRILGCVGMFTAFVEGRIGTWQGTGTDFLFACLRAVFELERDEIAAAQPAARMSGRGCALASFSGRTGSVVRRGDGSPDLRVTCARAASGMRIRVHATRGTLRRLLGPRLDVGVYRSQRADTGTTGVRFSRPRSS